MLQFLLRALESGEHRISVVGVGGVTIEALAHSFIDALIAEYEKHTPLQAPAPETVAEFPTLVEPAPAPRAPTDAEIAAYLYARAQTNVNPYVGAQQSAAAGDDAALAQQATALAGASYGFPKEGA
jgi:hypothetical protein